MSEEIIEVHFPENSPEDIDTINKFRAFSRQIYGPFCKLLKEKELWDDSIHEIIFCKDVPTFIDEYNLKWNTQYSLTKQREYYGVSQTLKRMEGDKTLTSVCLPLGIIAHGNEALMKFIFLDHILSLKAHTMLPIDIQKLVQNGINNDDINDFHIVVKYCLGVWVTSAYAKFWINGLMSEPKIFIEADKFLNSFKRNVKSDLFQVNSDDIDLNNNWNFFWGNYIYHFVELVQKLITHRRIENKKLELKDSKEAEILGQIIDAVNENRIRMISSREFDLALLSTLFVKYANYHGILLKPSYREGKNSMSIKITQNPKLIFKGAVVESVQHIVAFIDILGFKDMIHEYEWEPESSLLQQIKTALDEAIQVTMKKVGEMNYDLLEYRMFSDNLCAAVPYFSSKVDFLAQLGIIITLIRSYQFSMMEKGFYVRGGLTVGSYYSDENMIFSDGLVRAYEIESKEAKYPRIVIDNSIIVLINFYLKGESLPKNLSDAIVHCSAEDIYFINPHFNLVEALTDMESMINDISPELGSIFRMMRRDEDSESLEPHVRLEAIQKRLLNESLRLNEMGKTKEFEKINWLRAYNKWYLNRDLENFSFFRSKR